VQIAKWLGAPVVLVVDCWAMARSAAAVIKGYAEFDPGAHLVPWVCTGLQTAHYV
jgi:cobyrinic acid a,c-diamide synthase